MPRSRHAWMGMGVTMAQYCITGLIWFERLGLVHAVILRKEVGSPPPESAAQSSFQEFNS